MTTEQLHLFNGLYLVALLVVAVLTRATARRLAGALAGGAVAGGAVLGVIALGEEAGVWHFVIAWEPYFLTLLLVDITLSGGFVFLLIWRIARRFGGRGLAVTAAVAAVLGPPRDYAYLERFPEWGSYAPGVAPVFAIAATYVLLGVVGYGVMRLVAGPANADRLARRPWESAASAAGRPLTAVGGAG